MQIMICFAPSDAACAGFVRGWLMSVRCGRVRPSTLLGLHLAACRVGDVCALCVSVCLACCRVAGGCACDTPRWSAVGYVHGAAQEAEEEAEEFVEADEDEEEEAGDAEAEEEEEEEIEYVDDGDVDLDEVRPRVVQAPCGAPMVSLP